jgi:hypothetical protein
MQKCAYIILAFARTVGRLGVSVAVRGVGVDDSGRHVDPHRVRGHVVRSPWKGHVGRVLDGRARIMLIKHAQAIGVLGVLHYGVQWRWLVVMVRRGTRERKKTAEATRFTQLDN